MAHQNKKRQFPHYLHRHQQQPSERTPFNSISFLSAAGFGFELLSPPSLSYIETFLRPLVREEAEKKVEAYFKLPPSSSSGENEVVVGAGSGTMKLNLCFMNKIPSTIFTTNQIQAENAQPLQVALCDIAENIIVEGTNPLSSALIEFVVLDGEFEEGLHWSVDEFNKSVVTQRPSLVGKHKTTRLKNGVALVDNLTFTQNSSRSRTKLIRLGVRIIDPKILGKHPRVGEAVSTPFRVKDHRGQENMKGHPLRGEDEVYRLKEISRNGERHKRLSSQGIQTVGDFHKALQTDPSSLRKMLGIKNASDKKWNKMVKHASEYVPYSIPTLHANLQLDNQTFINPTTNYGHAFGDTFYSEFQHHHTNSIFQEAPTSNTHNYELENTNTSSNQHFPGTWTNNLNLWDNPNGWS